MSNEGKKKTLTSTPLPPSTIKNKNKKINVHPFPQCTLNPRPIMNLKKKKPPMKPSFNFPRRTMNRTLHPLVLLNNKK
jgi:hypothetical protein